MLNPNKQEENNPFMQVLPLNHFIPPFHDNDASTLKPLLLPLDDVVSDPKDDRIHRFWQHVRALAPAMMPLVNHDYLASMVFMAWRSGCPLPLSVRDFYPAETEPSLTGSIDDLLRWGIIDGVIVPCVTWHPRQQGTCVSYWVASDPAAGNGNAVHQRDESVPPWQLVVTYLLHDVDPLMVPLIALAEYLSLPVPREPTEDGVVAPKPPRELNMKRIRARYPQLQPLFPRLIQYHQMILALFQP